MNMPTLQSNQNIISFKASASLSVEYICKFYILFILEFIKY